LASGEFGAGAGVWSERIELSFWNSTFAVDVADAMVLISLQLASGSDLI